MSRAAITSVRLAVVFGSLALVLSPPIAAAGSAQVASTLTAVGQLNPTALGPGQPAAHRPAFARPFLTLDPGALRAAKLRAAAASSTGERKPLAVHVRLGGIFNNTNGSRPPNP